MTDQLINQRNILKSNTLVLIFAAIASVNITFFLITLLFLVLVSKHINVIEIFRRVKTSTYLNALLIFILGWLSMIFISIYIDINLIEFIFERLIYIDKYFDIKPYSIDGNDTSEVDQTNIRDRNSLHRYCVALLLGIISMVIVVNLYLAGIDPDVVVINDTSCNIEICGLRINNYNRCRFCQNSFI